MHPYNYIINSSSYPSVSKTTVMLSLPKISSPSILFDLRPISILPILSKEVERIRYDQLVAYEVPQYCYGPGEVYE
jgi:hypothetical protein